MNYAKEILTILTPIAIAWGMMYLLGAFVSASWNIAEWTAQARIVCALWGSVFGAALWHRLRTDRRHANT